MSSPLLTYTEAAALLAMTRGALRAAVARGAIPHVRLGNRTVRFDRDELVAWLAGCRVPARSAS